MRGLVLKAATTLLTVVTTIVSALYVTAHFKNPSAPLRPAVLESGRSQSVGVLGSELSVGPSVEPTTRPPLTSTYAS